jgi:5-(carboxyamino)imidazole ribonucleotide synthase
MKSTHERLPAGSMIGIIGGGQLGKMLAVAAAQLGYRTRVFSDVEGCAFDVATEKVFGDYRDLSVLVDFFQGLSVATLEFENIPLETFDLLGALGNDAHLYPGMEALRFSQDRALEKSMARGLGIKTPKFWLINRDSDLQQVKKFPVILKTCRLGYDGQGQRRAANATELMGAWNELGCVPCIAEEVIDFEFEFSIITCRWEDGRCATYPPFINTHHEGILLETWWMPWEHPRNIEKEAKAAAEAIAEHLKVVGLLAVEFFCDCQGDFIFNEIAPRPHNSGHVTIECAYTSQFEQHIRAILNISPGEVTRRSPGRMRNVIGVHEELALAIRQPGYFSVHDYGKKAVRGKRRKLGHITHILP